MSFIIEASDQGAKRKNTAQTTLTLNIEDVNNNAPELNIQLLVTTIPTSANTGATHSLVFVSNPPPNSPIRPRPAVITVTSCIFSRSHARAAGS